MFSNYMENMSPFVKLKRPRKKKKGLSRKGSFLSSPIVLCRGCPHSRSHRRTVELPATFCIQKRGESICTNASATQKRRLKCLPLSRLGSWKLFD